MRRSIHALLLASAALLLGCRDPAGSGATDPPVRADEPAAAGAPSSPEPSVVIGAGTGLWEVGVPVWREPPREQWFTAIDFRTLEVTDSRTNPQTGEVLSLTHSSQADFDVLRVGTAGEDSFGLAGFDDDGDLIVEHWRLVPVVAPGMATGGGPSTTQLGGPFTDPDEVSLVPKRFHKTRVFAGDLGDSLRAFDFDAEERFFLALLHEGTTSTLWRIENLPNPAPAVLLDSTAEPALVGSRFLAKYDHQMLGRVWVLDDSPTYAYRILFVDADNDGSFDGAPLVGDRSFFAGSGVDAYHLWDDLRGP